MSAKKLNWWQDPAQRELVKVGARIKVGDKWHNGWDASCVGNLHKGVFHLYRRIAPKSARPPVTVEAALTRIEKRLNEKCLERPVDHAFDRIDAARAEIRKIRKELKGKS